MLRLLIMRLRRRLGWYDKAHAARVQEIVRSAQTLDDMIARLRALRAQARGGEESDVSDTV